MEIIVTGFGSEASNQAGFSIFPIPCQNSLNFKADYLVESISIRDLAGRVMMQETLRQTNGTVNLAHANIQSGIYYLELIDDAGKLHRSAFVKQ